MASTAIQISRYFSTGTDCRQVSCSIFGNVLQSEIMGGYCSSGCCAGVPAKNIANGNSSKQPFKRSARNTISSMDTNNMNESDGSLLIFKNQTSCPHGGTLSTDTYSSRKQSNNSDQSLRSRHPEHSYVLLDIVDGGAVGQSIMSQLLVYITEELASVSQTADKNAPIKINLTPRFFLALTNELSRLSEQDRRLKLSILHKLCQEPQKCSCKCASAPSAVAFSSTYTELSRLEAELFDYFSVTKDFSYPLVNLRSCLLSRQVKPSTNRILLLNLRALLKHPRVSSNCELEGNMKELIDRLQASPSGLELTPSDSGLLLEVIATTNLHIFDPTSTPPVIFNDRDTPLIKSAMRISKIALVLREIVESQKLCPEKHSVTLKEAESLVATSSLTSHHTDTFFDKLISTDDKILLASMINELEEKSTGFATYRITAHMVKELSNLSHRFGLISLLCAKCTIARSLYTIKNRFRLKPNTSKRICIFELKDLGLIDDSISLVLGSPIVPLSEASRLQTIRKCVGDALQNSSSNIELKEDDAAYLQHVLTIALDYQHGDKKLMAGIHATLASPEAMGQRRKSLQLKPKHVAEQKDFTPSQFFSDGDTEEEFIIPVDASVVRNPFASPNSLDVEGFSNDMFAHFFDRNKEPNEIFDWSSTNPNEDAYIYENKTEISETASSVANTLTDDVQFNQSQDSNMLFKLLGDALLLKDTLIMLQRSPTRLFANKLTPFQIIQLCDSARKLTSVDPRAEDSKLIKNLSSEANRHLPVRLKLKTVGRLREFSNRVHAPVVESSIDKLIAMMKIVKHKTPTKYTSVVSLNTEYAFDFISVCWSALFDSIDTLSIFFLAKIKYRSISTSDSCINVSMAEQQYLNRLANQALAKLKCTQFQPSGESTHLLNLYKLRALVKAFEIHLSEEMPMKTIWCHALRQFFINYSDKAQKKVFSNVAFNVFICENENWPEDLKQAFLTEVNSLIKTHENNLADVKNMLVGKTKLNVELFKSYFYANVVNNRNLDRSPVMAGEWIIRMANEQTINQDEMKKEGIVHFFQPPSPTQERHGYTLDLDLELSSLRESILSGSEANQNLIKVEVSHLVKLSLLLSGSSMENSPRLAVIQVLLLEVLNRFNDNHSTYLDRSLLVDLLHGQETTMFEPEQEMSLMDAVDKDMNLQSAEVYLRDLITNDNLIASPDQLFVATQLLDCFTKSPASAVDDNLSSEYSCRLDLLKIEQLDFSLRIDHFITSDNCLIFAVSSLRSLIACFSKQKANVSDVCELSFILNLSQNYIHSSDALFEPCRNLEKTTRTSLIERSVDEVDINLLNSILAALEKQLQSKFSLSISNIILKSCKTRDKHELSNILQFASIVGVFLPMSLEIKLLSMALSLSTSNQDKMISEIAQQVVDRIELITGQLEFCQLRIITPLFPTALDTDPGATVQFVDLVRTLSNACCLCDRLGRSASASMNNIMAKLFWEIYFDNQRLTAGGVFGQLYNEVSKYRSIWLKRAASQSKSTNEAFFNKFFFTAPRLPLDENSKLINSGCKHPDQANILDLDAFPSSSYFPLLQALQVYETINLHTNAEVQLLTGQLLIIYHSLIILLSSGYLEKSIRGRIGIAFSLNEIEKTIRSNQSLTVDGLSLFASCSYMHEIFIKSVLSAKTIILKDLRSYIAPVILPMGSELGDPFTTPDLVLVKEAFISLLSGFFVFSESDAREALKLIPRFQESSVMVSKDLSRMCCLIENIFKAPTDRFSNPDKCSAFLQQQAPLNAEAACSMFDQHFNSLRTTKEVEVFFETLILLSKAVRSTNRCITPDLSTETFVSSPTESFASFSNLSNNDSVVSMTNTLASNTEILFQSFDSVTKSESVVLSVCPDRTLRDIKDKLIWTKVPLNNNAMLLSLEGYHYAQLLLYRNIQDETSLTGLKRVLESLFLLNHENLLLEHDLVEKFSQNAFNYLRQHLLDVIAENVKSIEDGDHWESLMRLLQGYFSLTLPIGQDVVKSAREFLILRIAWTRGTLSVNNIRQFVSVTLPFEAIRRLSVEETMSFCAKLTCLQAALKASENLPLTTTEQISFAYWMAKEKAHMVGLYAAIFWAKVWPIEHNSCQLDLLHQTTSDLKQALSEESRLFLTTNSDNLDARYTSAALACFDISHPCNLKFGDNLQGSDLLIRLAKTLQALPDCSNSLTKSPNEAICLITSLVAMRPYDSFVRLSINGAIKLAEKVHLIATKTEWFESVEDEVMKMRQRLYLAVACYLSRVGEKISYEDKLLELPASYLCIGPILSKLPQRQEMRDPRSVLLKPLTIGQELDIQPKYSPFTLPHFRFPQKRLISSQSCFLPYYSGSWRRCVHESLKSLPLCIDKSGSSLSNISMSSSKTSLDRLHEMIETRRAIVAGSMSELNLLGYGYPESKKARSFILPSRRLPGPWWSSNSSTTSSCGPDISALRRQLAENTSSLLKRSAYEEFESKIGTQIVEHNLKRLNKIVDDDKAL